MALPFRTVRRVEFCQTDAGGIMHFSAYFQMMEQAEHELLRAAGVRVKFEDEDRILSWPRVSAKCDFQRPARFEDELQIRVGVQKIGNRSVTYLVEFSREDQVTATGELVAVCCDITPGTPITSVDIPQRIVEALGKYLATESS